VEIGRREEGVPSGYRMDSLRSGFEAESYFSLKFQMIWAISPRVALP